MSSSASSILVTGGAGFIGSHLVEHLVNQGHDVVVLDNFVNGSRANLAAAPGCRIIEGDILDPGTCAAACEGVGVVYHLACLGVRHSLHNPLENHQVNALGSLHMLQAALKAQVRRFVYMSTSEVYGAALEFPLTEQSTTWPTTVYGSSKLAGEHYSAAYHLCHGLPVVRVRPFNNYGPRAHFEGDSGEVIPRFILRALAGQPPVIFGDGSHTRDFLYVKDCAAALQQIAGCDALVGQVVNLGYGEEIRIGTLAQTVLSAVGRTDLHPVNEAERPGDVPRLWVDPSRLRQHISWRPETGPDAGLAATVEYYKKVLAEDPSCLDKILTRNWVPPA